MTNRLDALFSGDMQPGIYQLDMSLRPGTICERAAAHGFACFYLNGARVFDKASLLTETAAAMAFPGYFGHNWDALEECVNDMSWADAEGYVLVYDHVAVLSGNHADVVNTFLNILRAAVDSWSQQSRPFYVLLRNTGILPQAIPSLE